MSFGFSVGDFISVLQIANDIRKRFVDAPSQFDDISEDIKSLSFLLQQIDDILPHRELSKEREQELCRAHVSCRRILEDLSKELDKWQDLGVSRNEKKDRSRLRVAWKRLRWEQKDIERWRERLQMNITSFTTLLQCLTSDTNFEIKVGVDKLSVGVEKFHTELEIVRSGVEKFHTELEIVRSGVDKLNQRPDDQGNYNAHEVLLNWFSAIDHVSQQSDIIAKRQTGTGIWLMETDEFQEWFLRPGTTMLCPGIPGAGKTVITATMIDELTHVFQSDSSVGFAYIYFNYQSQQELKLEDLLGSLVKQLLSGREIVPGTIDNLFGRHRRDRTRLTSDEVLMAFREASQMYSRIFIFLDALDEYHASTHEGLNAFLSCVFDLQQTTSFNLFATSRYISEVTSLFQDCLSKDIRAHEDDVRSYVSSRIPELLRGRISRHPDLQELVQKKVIDATDGMFLLSRLHMDSLRGFPTVGDLKRALQNLPQGAEGLHKTYDQAMERISAQDEGDRKLAHKVLTWVIHAARPLTTSEIVDALAIEIGSTELDTDFRPEVEDLDSLCAGLITVEKNTQIVQLVHYTAQEYFRRKSFFPDAETDITNACFTFLSFDVFATGPVNHDSIVERVGKYPLYEYAATQWGFHAGKASHIGALLLDFLQDSSKVSASTQFLLMHKDEIWPKDYPYDVQGIHLAAYFGLQQILTSLVSSGQSPDLKDSLGRTPLWYATCNGQQRMVRLLLQEHKVDPNFHVDGLLPTTLCLAISMNHIGVVEEILRCSRTDLNLKTSYGRTALHFAAIEGREEVVSLLLKDPRTQPSSIDEFGWTPLCIAAETKHHAVVKLMLDDGRMDPNARDNRGRTPIFKAVQANHLEVVKRFVDDARTDLNAKTNTGCGESPLMIAVKNGNVAIVTLLAEDPRVDINAMDETHQTALLYAVRRDKGPKVAIQELLLEHEHIDLVSNSSNIRAAWIWAAKSGNKPLFDMLIEENIEYDGYQDFEGRTVLSYAASHGHEHIVSWILSKSDIDPNTEDMRGFSPLFYASEKKHLRILDMLLEDDRVDVNSSDCHETTPLHYAAGEVAIEVMVRLLAKPGIQVNAIDDYGRTPLHHSVVDHSGVADATRLLLARGDVEVNMQDYKSRTPLHYAVRKGGNIDAARLLLERDDVQVNLKESDMGYTPLHMAATEGRAEAVRLLLGRPDIEVNAQDNLARTPLYLAAQDGHIEVIHALVERTGIDVDLKGYLGRTPLHMAAHMGHKKTVRVLVIEGKSQAIERVDEFHQETPVDLARRSGHADVVEFLETNVEDWTSFLERHVDDPSTSSARQDGLEIDVVQHD